MEIRSTLVRWWRTFATALGDFFEEAIFRLALAFNILVGRMPQRAEKRSWIRSVDVPVLVDVFDWTTDRLLFSVLVWPPLESPTRLEAAYDHHQRVDAILDAIAKGAKEKMWCTRWEVDYGLRWDHRRQVWIAADGFAYDTPRGLALPSEAREDT